MDASLNRLCLLATRNAHKLRELEALVPNGAHWRGLDGLDGVPEVVEDAQTFEGNAGLKARSLARWIGSEPSRLGALRERASNPAEILVVADDSGLEVDALGGAPGVHSARFAALDDGRPGNSPDPENNAKLLRLLEPVDDADRTARFRCVLAVLRLKREAGWGMDGPPLFFHGACEGFILRRPSGRDGFGYDPLFRPVGFHLTFAELGDGVKSQCSHRSVAARAMRQWMERASEVQGSS